MWVRLHGQRSTSYVVPQDLGGPPPFLETDLLLGPGASQLDWASQLLSLKVPIISISQHWDDRFCFHAQLFMWVLAVELRDSWPSLSNYTTSSGLLTSPTLLACAPSWSFPACPLKCFLCFALLPISQSSSLKLLAVPGDIVQDPMASPQGLWLLLF